MTAAASLCLAIATTAALWFQAAHAAREEDRHSWTGSTVKTLATGALVAAGIASEAPGPILIGLALGSLGDLALSRPGTPTFLGGMAAFAAGHLAYVWAFWSRAAALGFDTPSPMQWALIGALGALVLALGLWLSAKAGPLRAAVLAYACIIGLMAVAALILPSNQGRPLIWLGAALFLLSDTLLALRLFVARAPKPRRALGLAVWPSYWLGQALILGGSLIYWGQLGR